MIVGSGLAGLPAPVWFHCGRNNNMRLALLVAAASMVLIIAATLGLNAIMAPHPKDLDAALASTSIDAMEMMKGARNLPVQRFDAH